MYINNTKLTLRQQKPKCLKLKKSYPEKKKTNILIVIFGACKILL